MEQSVIFEKLTKVFQKVFNDDTIILRNDLSANDIANWDSLTHMVMISEVENIFSIKFKLKELSKLEDVGSLIGLVTSKLNK